MRLSKVFQRAGVPCQRIEVEGLGFCDIIGEENRVELDVSGFDPPLVLDESVNDLLLIDLLCGERRWRPITIWKDNAALLMLMAQVGQEGYVLKNGQGECRWKKTQNSESIEIPYLKDTRDLIIGIEYPLGNPWRTINPVSLILTGDESPEYFLHSSEGKTGKEVDYVDFRGFYRFTYKDSEKFNLLMNKVYSGREFSAYISDRKEEEWYNYIGRKIIDWSTSFSSRGYFFPRKEERKEVDSSNEIQYIDSFTHHGFLDLFEAFKYHTGIDLLSEGSKKS